MKKEDQPDENNIDETLEGVLLPWQASKEVTDRMQGVDCLLCKDNILHIHRYDKENHQR